MNEATADLLDMLTDYSDDSDLQPPIKKGDELHKAIVAHRKALGRSLPADESKLMRKLLDLSCSKKLQDRRDSQDVASDWAELIAAKYGEQGAIPTAMLDKMSPSQIACVEALTDEPQRTHEVADAAGIEKSTGRKALRALATMNPPLAKRVPRGYIRPRPK